MTLAISCNLTVAGLRLGARLISVKRAAVDV